jgi:hypothetical protein
MAGLVHDCKLKLQQITKKEEFMMEYPEEEAIIHKLTKEKNNLQILIVKVGLFFFFLFSCTNSSCSLRNK